MIHAPTAPWAHTIFDLFAWGAGLGLVVAGVPAAAIGFGLFLAGRSLRGVVARPRSKSIWPPPLPAGGAP